MESSKLFFYIICCITILRPTTVVGTSVTTLGGPDLNKAIVETAEFTLGFHEYVYGTVELLAGVLVNDTAYIGTNLPVGNHLRWGTPTTFRPGVGVQRNLHLDGSVNGAFLLDASSHEGRFESYSFDDRSTIFLDSDMTVSGNNRTTFYSIIIDGQGHTIDCSHSLQGGLILGGKCTLKNVTLKNVWSSIDPVTLNQMGNFIVDITSVDTDQSSVTLDNVNIIARTSYPVTFFFGDNNLVVPFPMLLNIQNDVLLGGGGQFGLFRNFFKTSGPGGIFTIFNNSRLIIDNSTFAMGGGNNQKIDFLFQSESAQLALNNGLFTLDNNNISNGYALDLTVTLSVGTVAVNGDSYLAASSLLGRNGKSSLRLGDGATSAGDMNIIISAGATLSLVSTNSNCSVKLQSIH